MTPAEERELLETSTQLRVDRDRATALLRSVVNHWNEFGPYHGFEEEIDRAEAWLKRQPLPPPDEHRTSRGILMAISAGVIIYGVLFTLWKAFT